MCATYLKVRLEGEERNQSEIGDMAMKLLELSQTLKNKWVTENTAEKRAIKDATLAMTIRKPFDTLAEGLKIKNGTDGWNRTTTLWVMNPSL